MNTIKKIIRIIFIFLILAVIYSIIQAYLCAYYLSIIVLYILYFLKIDTLLQGNFLVYLLIITGTLLNTSLFIIINKGHSLFSKMFDFSKEKKVSFKLVNTISWSISLIFVMIFLHANIKRIDMLWEFALIGWWSALFTLLCSNIYVLAGAFFKS